MNPGQPILNKDEDKFERLSFAKHLGSFLCLEEDAPSIVVGIEGKWGEGKTSCINLIKEALYQYSPQPIIVDYRPWLISTLDSIVEGFFIELASALGTQSKSSKARTAAHKVLQFGKILSPIKLIPGVEPWGTMVESVLNAVGQSAKAASELASLSIYSRKNDLQKSLENVNRPIVVIIDDIDRLPPEHVRIVFQMLKAVCDFNRVSYLVAYDPKPVIKALSYNRTYDGRRYLEKIIQISYPLPRLSYIRMKDYTISHLNALAARYKLNITGEEDKRLEILFSKTDFVRLFVAPRDVIRLFNRLCLSAPNTRNEVCFADLIAFETLELKFPELSRIIRNEPENFVSLIYSDKEFISGDTFATSDFTFNKRAEEKDESSFLDQLIKRLGPDENMADPLKSLLLFLFPKLRGKDYQINDIPENINRIHNRDAFLKLLHSGVVSFTYSAEDARRFCVNPGERTLILAGYRDAGDLFNWIDYLVKVAINAEIADEIGLCTLLIAEVQGPEVERSHRSLSRRVGEFLYEIIKTRSDTLVKNTMLNEILRNTRSLSVSETVLRELLSVSGIWKGGKYFTIDKIRKENFLQQTLTDFSHEELYSAKDVWLNSVRSVATGEGIMETQKDVLNILHRWGQLNGNDYREPQNYVIKCSEDGSWLRNFMRLFNIETNITNIIPFIPSDQIETFIGRIRKIENGDTRISSIADYLRTTLEESKKDKSEGQATNPS